VLGRAFYARISLQLSSGEEYTLFQFEMIANETTRHECHRGHVDPDFVDDLELLQSFQGGCDKCFAVLFARYWKLVFTVAWKILRQRTDAEDIVQEVFLTIYLQRDKYDPTRGSVKTWIVQFAHFKALIKRRYLQTRELANLDEFSEFESGLLQHGASQGALERGVFVEECLAVLNPRQRRTVELIHFDGYTLLETAAVLKQSLANTRNICYRGMEALRVQLLASRKHAARNESGLAADIPETAAKLLILGTD
jgi:RNA polymerase sigma-70 factor, ECF subfamily